VAAYTHTIYNQRFASDTPTDSSYNRAVLCYRQSYSRYSDGNTPGNATYNPSYTWPNMQLLQIQSRLLQLHCRLNGYTNWYTGSNDTCDTASNAVLPVPRNLHSSCTPAEPATIPATPGNSHSHPSSNPSSYTNHTPGNSSHNTGYP
jgi:hypothetical protein